jgi:hypothetical protein
VRANPSRIKDRCRRSIQGIFWTFSIAAIFLETNSVARNALASSAVIALHEYRRVPPLHLVCLSLEFIDEE